MKRETPEVESLHSSQDAHRTGRSTVCPGPGQVSQHHSSLPEAQYMRRHPCQGSENCARVQNTHPSPKVNQQSDGVS